MLRPTMSMAVNAAQLNELKNDYISKLEQAICIYQREESGKTHLADDHAVADFLDTFNESEYE